MQLSNQCGNEHDLLNATLAPANSWPAPANYRSDRAPLNTPLLAWHISISVLSLAYFDQRTVISNTLISVVGAAVLGAARMTKPLSIMMLAAVMMAGSAALGRAQEGAVAKATADAFDARLFAGAPGRKAYACFVRHYDADHLVRHLNQKVSAMQLLMTAEMPPEQPTIEYSFRLGVKYRHRTGDFDSSGYCNHAVAEDAGREIRFACGVDCEGGGINVALANDDKSTIIRLDRITVWQRNKPDDEAGDALLAGADDKIFRLDRTDNQDCAALVTDRKDLAAIRHK
jgi:hypothetical protein